MFLPVSDISTVNSSYLRGRQARGFGFSPPFVCMSVRTTSQKPMQLGAPNLTEICSKMSTENPSTLGSEGQRSRSPAGKHCGRGVGLCNLVSAGSSGSSNSSCSRKVGSVLVLQLQSTRSVPSRGD